MPVAIAASCRRLGITCCADELRESVHSVNFQSGRLPKIKRSPFALWTCDKIDAVTELGSVPGGQILTGRQAVDCIIDSWLPEELSEREAAVCAATAIS